MVTEVSTPSPQDPRVGVVILNWNAWQDTLECLESVQRLSYPNYFIIVVDNGSDDGSAQQMKAWAKANSTQSCVLVEYDPAVESGENHLEKGLDAPRALDEIALIAIKENLGRTRGLNLGITYALRRKPPADYVFIIDNDAVAEKDCLTALVELDRRANAGVVGGLVLDYPTGKVQFSGRRTLLRHFFSPILDEELPVPEQAEYWTTLNISGPVMLFRRDVLEAVFSAHGWFFDSGIFIDGEELAFCHAARTLGFQCLVTKAAVVRHKGQRRYRSQYNPMRYYYTTRNYIILANRLLPLPWKALFHVLNVPLSAARVAKNLLRGDAEGARAVLDGLIDGYRGIGGTWKRQPVAREKA